MQFIIVTGMSGSGKSSAIDVLEDIGYYCIDNMPPELITKFTDICNRSEGKLDKVAFVADIRGGDFFMKLTDIVEQLKAEQIDMKILFLDSSDDAIIRRYKETRRKHPLDEVSYGNIRRAIETERELLVPIKSCADYYIDTSSMAVAEFKERMYSMFMDPDDQFLRIDVRSFGFKYGSVSEADLVFDVRCLPNPFYIPELKDKTGLNSEVSDYVLRSADLFIARKENHSLLLHLAAQAASIEVSHLQKQSPSISSRINLKYVFRTEISTNTDRR